MSATRIHVEWMERVPINDAGESDYDNAEWRFKEFDGEAIKQARMFARVKAQRNPWRQAWIRVEHAPSMTAAEWQWERDYGQDEIVEAA